MSESQRERQPLVRYDAVAVWPIIHMIREDVMHFIDTPLSIEALTAPDLTYTLVRPLEDKYNAIQRAGNKSVVFCFLLNRVHFTRDQNLTTSPLSCTRADLCELLATRILRDNGDSLLDLAVALTTSWPVWSGANPRVVELAREERDDALEERIGNALEMAIISKARRFIKCSPCQKVINGIWIGKCVYQAESSHSILSDRYKRNPIHFYDPHKAPLLDHYRLKVPAIRSVLEYINFLVLFILFVVAIETNQPHKINGPELMFLVYALGFALEKLAAMQEHGIRVYSKGTWNGFDLAFVTTYFIYATFRIYGIACHKRWARDLGNDFLAIIACLMFPRLAFVTLRNNLMVLSLRAMMMQFVALMLIAAFCFCGFLYALWTLSRKGAGHSASTIAWWMLDLWFGLDASGFDRASEFDVVFGPILMITYACLSNTLLLTVLVSILSNTFARINEDAVAETMFRKAVSMLEGVKADSLFSYQPPVNIVALCILLPSSYILSPRWFHKVNVFLIRVTNFPILLAIAWYERQRKKSNSISFSETVSTAVERIYESLPRPLKRMSLFEGLAGWGADIDVIFEVVDLDEEEVDAESPDEAVPRSRNPPGHRPDNRGQPLHQEHADTSTAWSSAQKGTVVSESRTNGHGQGTAPIGFRRRMGAHLHRSDVAQSPLAQIFQPVALQEEAFSSGETLALPPPGVNEPHGMGYGSVGGPRRRRSARLSTGSSQARNAGPRRMHLRVDTRPEALATGPPVSSSLGQRDLGPSSTAEQVEENIEESGGMMEVLQRMKKLEEKQERIEALLVRLSQRMTSS